jgi:hypothetical protein
MITLAIGNLLAEEQKPPTTNAPVTVSNLLLREVHYDGKLTDSQARFTVDIDAESFNKGESFINLFEGDVAILPARLPSGLRIVREGQAASACCVETRPI